MYRGTKRDACISHVDTSTIYVSGFLSIYLSIYLHNREFEREKEKERERKIERARGGDVPFHSFALSISLSPPYFYACHKLI